MPDEHDKVVLDLLFCMAAFHGLAKLRMHTGALLKLLEDASDALGAQLRYFKRTTCNAYYGEQTFEVVRGGRRRKAGEWCSKMVNPTELHASARNGRRACTTGTVQFADIQVA